MKLIIDIDKEKFSIIKNKMYCGIYDSDLYKAIENGISFPDNATVGEVFCMLTCKEPICETASYFTIDKKLWNSPYQKGSING
jgi:hypothetical protein